MIWYIMMKFGQHSEHSPGTSSLSNRSFSYPWCLSLALFFLLGLQWRQNCISNYGIVLLKTFEMGTKLVYIPVLGVFYKPSKERGDSMSHGGGGEVNARFLCPNIEWKVARINLHHKRSKIICRPRTGKSLARGGANRCWFVDKVGTTSSWLLTACLQVIQLAATLIRLLTRCKGRDCAFLFSWRGGVPVIRLFIVHHARPTLDALSQ